MKKILPLLLLLLLTGCAPVAPIPTETIAVTPPVPDTQPIPSAAPTQAQTAAPTQPPPDPIEELLASMTTEEKVGQLFLARYNKSKAAAHVTQYPLGGFILFSGAFRGQTPESMTAEIAALQARSSVPLLMAVDEEGGTVTRISRYAAFRDQSFPSPRSLYMSGGETLLLKTEAEKCRLLASLGLNVNMGPVCDITTDPWAYMYARSLGQDPQTTGALVAAMVDNMNEHGIGSVLKHFPGYGNNADTHVGIARDNRSLEALEAADLIPFQAGIDAGCGAILISHTIVAALDDSLPASLSPTVLEYLRAKMGFDGVTITDDLAMEAITDAYGVGEAAVLAVLAGNDLLCSTEYVTQYEAVLQAVREGRISMERLDEAVIRVLRWKQELGLLEFDA